MIRVCAVRKICSLCIVLLLGAASLLPAQVASRGSVNVRTHDGRAMAVAGARVAARTGTSVVRSASTDADGKARLSLPPGTYDIIVEQLGYRPVHLQNVAIVAGSTQRLDVELPVAEFPLNSPVVITHHPSAVATSVELEELLFIGGMRMPDRSRELGDVVRSSTTASQSFSAEGLPARFTRFGIDGLRFDVAHGLSGGIRTPAFTTTSFSDVVIQGTSLNATTQSASSGGALGFLNNTAGGVQLSAGLKNGGGVAFGLEAQRMEIDLPAAWRRNGILDTRVLDIARDSFSIDLSGYTQPYLQETRTVSAYGGLDLSFGTAHALAVRMNYGRATENDLPGGWSAYGVRAEDIAANAVITSEISPRLVHELRAGIGRSVRELGAASDAALRAPLPTRIVSSAIEFGSETSQSRFERTAFRVQPTLHYAGDLHRLRGGIEAALTRYDDEDGFGRAGNAWFGTPEHLAARTGSFIQLTGPPPAASFEIPRISAFAEHTWSPFSDVTFTTGLRYSVEQLPVDRFGYNAEWIRLTGMLPALPTASKGKIDPHASVAWSIGDELSLRASAAISHDESDPSLISELIWNDGRVRARRVVGSVASWPLVGDADSIAAGLPQLTLAPAQFERPESFRTSVDISRALGELTFTLNGVFRRTSAIARRFDINVLSAPGDRDEHGRYIYGSLVQLGDLLTVAPGSNRRFASYDAISAFAFDGESHYAAATVAATRVSQTGLNFSARYTYSRTLDNLYGAALFGARAQMPGAVDSANADVDALTTSDFDAPHRLVFAAELPLPGRARIGALYRFESGRPFTPGFRAGVDVNGDGISNGDPAFIDTELSGMTEVMNDWHCLDDQAGRFARRNSCRSANHHTLDLRLQFHAVKFSRYNLDVVIDGLGVFESRVGQADGALYLVDSTGSLERENGMLRVPFVVNPQFGQTLLHSTAGRQLRAEVRISY